MLYGIPNFKMEKKYINRRMQQMEVEGENSFVTQTLIDIQFKDLENDFDAIVTWAAPKNLEIYPFQAES